MAEITTYKSVSITDLMARLDSNKHNPSSIQRVILEHLDEITNGEVDIVDPTNPFVFLLESSAVNTALAVNENIINLRKQYPSLAQTEEDIYMHLSTNDFLNRFSTPAETDFTVVIQVNDLMNKMIYDSSEKCFKAIIARDTEFTIDAIVFTLQYPIVIRKFENGVVQISYDASIVSPLGTLTTNIIDYVGRKDTTTGLDWLFFTVKVKQFSVNSVHFPLQKSIVFEQNIPYDDQFYYVRAFYKNNASGSKWLEIKTTHTDQVYDPYQPTAVVKVYDGYLNVAIPIVYLTAQLLSGEVRFDLYTTKGNMTMNLSNYKLNSFAVKLKAIDEERDINEFSNVMLNMSFYVYSEEVVNGGSNGIDFETLRNRVIFNTTGEAQLPITNVDLEAYVNNRGFDLVKNTDVLTNRVFLATQKLPKPINNRLATSANIGISTYVSNLGYLRTLSTVKDNGNRLTLLSKNLYKNVNGIVSLVTALEIEAIRSLGKAAMVNHLNNNQYIHSPFYYVLDSTQSEFDIRAYNLDYPKAAGLSFISQNQTLQLPVNTGSYTLTKLSDGYRLTVVTKSGNFYKQLEDGLVSAQLAYYPSGEKFLTYINGVFAGLTADEERIYTFDIKTNYDIDADDRMAVKNSRMFTNESVTAWTELEQTFHLFYATSSVTDNFVPDAADALLGKFILPVNSSAVTYETISLQFGTSLKNLWRRSRSIPTGLTYRTHALDVPMVYEKDVYQRDATLGSIFSMVNGNIVYNILHRRGDPVLSNGLPVYKHRRGDVVLGDNGLPIVDSEFSVDKELDMMFIDGKHYFVDDKAFIDYNSEIVSIVDTWVTEDISAIQDKLLEQTRIFFYPKTTLGKVKIFTEDNGEDFVSSEQSLTVNLYVKPSVYNDSVVRENLVEATVSLLDTYISGVVVNITEIVLALAKLYGDSVLTLDLMGLGGEKNYKIVTLATEHNRFCLKKIIELQQDNTLIIREDVTVNFFKMS